MRPARVSATADLSALARLHASCFAQGWSEQALRELAETPGTIVFAVPDGFVVVRVAADELEILTLAVAPQARRKGLGTALLGEAARHAHTLGARTMILEAGTSNAAARALYGRFGFRAVGERKSYYAASEDALILRAELPLAPLGKSQGSTRVGAQPRGKGRDAD